MSKEWIFCSGFVLGVVLPAATAGIRSPWIKHPVTFVVYTAALIVAMAA